MIINVTIPTLDGINIRGQSGCPTTNVVYGSVKIVNFQNPARSTDMVGGQDGIVPRLQAGYAVEVKVRPPNIRMSVEGNAFS